MANGEHVQQWVMEQTALLVPPAGWEPNLGSARARFDERVKSDRRRVRWPVWVAAAALVVAVFLMLPATRAVAYQLWQSLTVPRVTFIRVKPWPEGIASPKVALIGDPIPPIPARDVEEVRRRVRYEPRLPRPGVFSSSPQLYTTFSLSAGTVIRTADLERALKAAGIAGAEVPATWEGAQLALHTSSVVIAEWPDIVLVQSLPLTLTAPPGFDFAAFSALILRVLGVGPEQAQKFAQQMGTAPAWIAPLAFDVMEGQTMEQVALKSGPATLFLGRRASGILKRTTVVWSVADRVYVLSGEMNRELAIAAANAVE